MISFVWMSNYPFLAGTGGSENYTAGHIRELQRRGIESRIITIGMGTNDGRADFPDITFKALKSVQELSKLDDTLVFVTYPHKVKTKRQAYVILHCPLSLCDHEKQQFTKEDIAGKRLISTSQFAANWWAHYFGIRAKEISVVYPFAEPCFSKVERPTYEGDAVRVLFAGRLTPDKGIYTLMSALHMNQLKGGNFTFSATTAGAHTPEGQIVQALLKAHPLINLVPAQRSPEAMAKLISQFDVVVMPTTSQFWQETFGILSVEAQHAGCQVVASHAGGLPETDCGSLITIEPDNPLALAQGLSQAARLGRPTARARTQAGVQFTVAQSVDNLLEVLRQDIRVAKPQAVPILANKGTVR